MAAGPVGLPVWATGVWADTVWEVGTWEAATGVNPFGDVRRGSFGPLGTRIRRAAVWLALALFLVG